MILLYHYAALFNAALCFVIAGIVFWKNRHQRVGPLLGLALTVVGAWLGCYAQYFAPLTEPAISRWAYWTLTMAALIQPTLFHAMTLLADRERQMRWWVVAAYAVAGWFVVRTWQGAVILAPRFDMPHMHHYVRYDPYIYPLLAAHLLVWQLLGVGVQVAALRQATGYHRTQLIYSVVTWLIFFLTAHITIIPLEYGLKIPPFGFFFLPLNLFWLAYVLSRARLTDFNEVIARVLLYAVMMVVVVGISLLFWLVVMLVEPSLMSETHMTISLVFAATIALGLTFTLPRWLPRAERMLQDRFFSARYGYQEVLSGLVKELARMPNIDRLLTTVANTVHSQMQVTRVVILMQDALSGVYRLRAESGLNIRGGTEAFELQPDAAILRWLNAERDTLVADEASRLLPTAERGPVLAEMERLGLAMCVPLMDGDRLTGVLGLGPKLGYEPFFSSDVRVLETLATEMVLAVKYQRMEEEISRKNKLAELGTIAAGVAHEIRNPLASIRTFAQLLPERGDDPEFKNEFSKLVLQDVERITRVIETMLAFARPAQVTIAEYRLPELVEEAVLLVQPRLKSRQVELVRQFDRPITVRVDKQQIIQVLVNLLSNAVDAVPSPGGRIRITTGVQEMADPAHRDRLRRYAVIEVADNGAGIPAAVRDRLFNPFFTTKKDGTGLGLSISQKIVRDHGGIITVSSVEGQGSSFQVNLPLH